MTIRFLVLVLFLGFFSACSSAVEVPVTPFNLAATTLNGDPALRLTQQDVAALKADGLLTEQEEADLSLFLDGR